MTTKLWGIGLDLKIRAAEYAYRRSGVMPSDRHRMSMEIAQELKAQMGDGAYLYCLERLSNNTEQPRLWRDVLYWLDGGEDGGRTNGLVSDNP